MHDLDRTLLQVDDDEDQDNNVNSSVKHLLQKVEEIKRKVSDLDIEQHCIRNKICGILEYQDHVGILPRHSRHFPAIKPITFVNLCRSR